METSKKTNSGSDAEALAKLAKSGELIAAEVGKIIVGQVDVIAETIAGRVQEDGEYARSKMTDSRARASR